MPRLTERDKKCIVWLSQTGLPATTQDLAIMFFPSISGSISSSLTVASRRLDAMAKLNQISKYPRRFSCPQIWYVGNKPNERSLNHRLHFTRFIAKLVENNFRIIDTKTEYRMPEKYGIIADLFLTVEYGTSSKQYFMFVEIDISKAYNTNWKNVIFDLDNGLLKSEKEMIFVSVCNARIDDEELRKRVIHIDLNYDSFNKLIWYFIDK